MRLRCLPTNKLIWLQLKWLLLHCWVILSLAWGWIRLGWLTAALRMLVFPGVGLWVLALASLLLVYLCTYLWYFVHLMHLASTELGVVGSIERSNMSTVVTSLTIRSPTCPMLLRVSPELLATVLNREVELAIRHCTLRGVLILLKIWHT
jgi:hypothetical protein